MACFCQRNGGVALSQAFSKIEKDSSSRGYRAGHSAGRAQRWVEGLLCGEGALGTGGASCDDEYLMNPLLDETMEGAHVALAMGDMAAAAALYRKATEIDPAYAEGWQALGMALVKLDQLNEAIEALQKLIQLKPKDQLAYSSLSLAKAKVAGWGGDPTKIGA